MSGNLQFYKNIEKKLIDEIERLKQKEQEYREKFPPNTCVQERLNEILRPILDTSSRLRNALSRVQKIIADSQKTKKQRREEYIEQLKKQAERKLQGKIGKVGRDGKAGINAMPKKCK